MKVKKILRRIIRIVLWLFLGIGAITLLLIGLLQVPAVQDRLTGYLEENLSDQLATEVRIGRIGLDFPKVITIEDVYLATPAGEDLFKLGKLGVDIDMIRLFSREVIIQKVKIEDIFTEIVITDSTSNIQFLLDAFVTTDTSAGPAPSPGIQDTTTVNWTLNFPNTSLQIDRADIYYQDDPIGIILDGNLDRLELSTETVDLIEQVYDIDQAHLSGGDITLVFRSTSDRVDTLASEAPPTPMQISSRLLEIDEISFNLQADSMNLALQIPESRLREAHLRLQDALSFDARHFSVRSGQYAMNLPGPKLQSGLDLNHLDLKDIQIDLSDIRYAPDSILATIGQLQASDQSGFALEQVSGNLNYQPTQLQLSDFQLTTPQSRIDIPSLSVLYNFQETYDPDAPFELDSETRLDVAVADILQLLPQLDTIDVLNRNRDRHIQAELLAVGNRQFLKLDRMVVDGPGLEFRAAGEFRQVLNMDSLNGTIQLEHLAVVPSGFLPLLPDSLLPAYIDWPQFLQVKGDVRYNNQIAKVSLQATEQRDSSPINSTLTVSGQIRDLRNYPESGLDLSMDTIRATRYSALAYLPENSIPEGYRLPDFIGGKGTVKGPLDDLEVDLQLATPSERTKISVRGQVRQVLNSDSLALDLQIPLLLVDIPELREILPDSTLPTDFNLPDFRITNGKINGRTDDLDFNLPFTTRNGNGLFAGHYAPERFSLQASIEDFRPEALFQGARADTLALLDLEPLRMRLRTSGQFDPELKAKLSLAVFEGAEQGALLELEGTALRDTFSGEMTFSHPDLQGSATAFYLQSDSLAEVKGSIQIRRADLERWRLSDRPLYLSGQTSFSTKGLRMDDLSARLYMNDILLRSDTSSAFVDTLFAYAEMHGGNNEIEIFSDLLNFSLEGSFRPALVVGEIQRFIEAYWREELIQPDPVVYGNFINAYLEIRNPKPLISGVIPGLRRLSPMSANFTYRERSPELIVTADLPLLNYAGIRMDSLVLDTRGSEGKINYQADWKGINLFDQIILGRTQIKGENIAGAMGVDLQVWNDEKQLRHHLEMAIDPEADSLMIKLSPEQLIDNNTWTIPEDNLLSLSRSNIRVNNWQLQHRDQSIRLTALSRRELEIALNKIDIAPFGRLIRSEEEIVAGVLDGTVLLKDPLDELKFATRLNIEDLSIYSKLWGDLSLNLENQDAAIYRIDMRLSEAANDLSVTGTIVPNGAIALQVDIGSMMLESIEPLSLGYLDNAQGYLTGQLSIGGTFATPSYQGELRFVNAAINIALLQTRFAIDDQPIRFNGQNIAINELILYDPQKNEAKLSGNVKALSLSNYAFNLRMRARDFLIMNSNADDNPLYYGYLRVDADVEITGDVYQPVLVVDASPKTNSRLTYNLIQNTVPSAESRSGVVRFVEQYEWQQTIIADSLEQVGSGQPQGFELTTTLNVNPGLEFTVVIDPVTGDQFSGRGNGDIVFHQFPDGRMEMTGRIEMIEGVYDFTYQGLINRKFTVETGSSVSWQGDPMNPNLDLTISSYIQASPYALVNEFGNSTGSNLRRQQTFAVRMYLDGTLEAMQVNTDIIYPEDISGNSGLPAIEQSLTALRTDQSQLNTQAFGLLLFKGFVNFNETGGAPPGGTLDNSVQSGLDNVLSQQLNNLANRYISFVELDFGMESFNTSQGGRQRDLRLSLRKRLFNDRLIISIDGVTQTGETDENNTLPQTYLDNLTAEFLLSKNGGLRLKVFSDRELDQFTTGDVVRIGGRLAFTKDFNHFFWSSKQRPNRDVPGAQVISGEGSRESEQKIKLEKE